MNEDPGALSRRSFLQAGSAIATASGMMTLSSGSAAAAAYPQFKGANVSLIADALNGIGHDPVKLSMSPDIKAHVDQDETMIGPAMTTKWQVGRGRMTRDDVLDYIYRPLDAAKPGTVWVVASGTDRILSLFGDIIAQACKRNGLAGAVTDSGFRDLARIKQLGFPVFAKSTIPHGPADFIRPVAVNVPVVCGGVAVRPGDLVAADIDGVIVIPREAVPALADAVSGQFATEQRQRNQIAAGGALADTH